MKMEISAVLLLVHALSAVLALPATLHANYYGQMKRPDFHLHKTPRQKDFGIVRKLKGGCITEKCRLHAYKVDYTDVLTDPYLAHGETISYDEKSLKSFNYENDEREECPFSEFNARTYSWWYDVYEEDYPRQFIQQAAVEERKNTNQIIVYHGESVGIWLMQLFAKQVTYPDAKDWLPLRFQCSHGDVSASDLKRIIHDGIDDWSPEFTEIGLAAHVNLMSCSEGESASNALRERWDIFHGCATFEKDVRSYLKPLELANEDVINGVQERLEIILQFIGWRMSWKRQRIGTRVHRIDDGKLLKLFPSLSEEEVGIIETARKNYFPRRMGSGIVLQISMPPNLADRQSYASGKFGKVKNEQFMEFYNRHKNKLDNDGQIRIAMGYPFTRYPSPVKITALSPIHDDDELLRMVDKMIVDTADFSQKRSLQE